MPVAALIAGPCPFGQDGASSITSPWLFVSLTKDVTPKFQDTVPKSSFAEIISRLNKIKPTAKSGGKKLSLKKRQKKKKKEKIVKSLVITLPQHHSNHHHHHPQRGCHLLQCNRAITTHIFGRQRDTAVRPLAAAWPGTLPEPPGELTGYPFCRENRGGRFLFWGKGWLDMTSRRHDTWLGTP